MLCEVCVGAIHHRKGWVRNDRDAADPHVLLAHHESVASLEASAADACEVCYPFWCQIGEDNQTEMKRFDPEWNSRHGTSKNPRVPGQALDDFAGLVTLCAIVNLGQEEDIKPAGMDLLVSLTFESDFRDEISTLKGVSGTYVVLRGSGRDTGKMTPFSSSNTASDESWSKATAWVQKCRSGHRACNVEANGEPWRPTRLLDLAAPGSDPDTFRIVATSKLALGRDERYTTLSHCWGSARFLQLKKSTYDKFARGVDLGELPKTFREAVQVTRKLGVRFLWIDSLCILQDRDDLSDWLLEAAQMHKVYSHSYCNISAAGARDSSKGLFFDRDPRLSHTADVAMCVEGLGLGADYVDCSVVDLGFWGHGIGQCPLNTRGWVLQERLLSPRVLHFARGQLFWECREHAAAECYPESLPEALRDGVPAKFKRLDPISQGTDVASRERAADDPMFYYRVWNSIVQSYSDTRLTKSSDKLIALSGVAKHFATRIDDTYVVGMWRKYLASSLLWKVDGGVQIDGSPSARPAPYRAPSFSWASVDGRVTAAAPTEASLLIEVVDVRLEYVSGDTTGLVNGGYIELRGQVRPFEMVVKYVLELQQLFLGVDGLVVKDSLKQDWENGPLVHLDVGQKSFAAENGAGALYYMPTQEQKKPGDYVSYLLLLASDESRKTFRRIGVAVTAEATEIETLNGTALDGARGPTTHREGNREFRTIRIL